MIEQDKINVVEEVISVAGSVSALAETLGVSQQLVSYWRGSRRFPLTHIPNVVKHYPQFTYQYLVDNAV